VHAPGAAVDRFFEQQLGKLTTDPEPAPPELSAEVAF